MFTKKQAERLVVALEKLAELPAAVGDLAHATRLIASGDVNGPNGLELVAMALHRSDGTDSSLAHAVRDLAQAVEDKK